MQIKWERHNLNPLAERRGVCELAFTVLVEVVVDMCIGERACSEGN
jgi:hypothetical protein